MGAMEDNQAARRRRNLSVVEGKAESPQRRPHQSRDMADWERRRSQEHHEQDRDPQRHSRRRRRRRRRYADDEEEPFWRLFMRVGAVVFSTFFILLQLYRWGFSSNADDGGSMYNDDNTARADGDSESLLSREINAIFSSSAASAPAAADPPAKTDDDDDTVARKFREEAEKFRKDQLAKNKTAPPMPTFALSDTSKYDVFGIVEMLRHGRNHSTSSTDDADTIVAFLRTVETMMSNFSNTYGGENAVRMMLDKGLSTFPNEIGADGVPSDIASTACRYLKASEEDRPFHMAFAGYSVTAGRGNYFNQSFPFAMQRLLEAPFRIAGLQLDVRNAAIGGCPAFPYGWCLTNFLGEKPDVISWDYAMNEAGGVPEGLEAYVRHALTSFHGIPPPKLIVKDTYMAVQRQQVLRHYVRQGELLDPVVLHSDPAARPMLEREEAYRPVGFQQWRKFGARLTAPGQALHHPAVKEHDFLAWLLSMHFVEALAVFVYRRSDADWRAQCHEKLQKLTTDELIPPVSNIITNATGSNYPSQLFGSPITKGKNGNDSRKGGFKWRMNSMQCRTSFVPLLSGNLTSNAIAGTVGEDIDLLYPKSQMFYNDGWTYDLSESEKGAKKRLSTYDHGLGFIDGKQAYYGILQSGTMSIWLPYEHNQQAKGVDGTRMPPVGDPAVDWFSSILVCQVNEKRDYGECKAEADLSYKVDGANVTTTSRMSDAGTLFLGKKLCTVLTIPPTAKITTRRQAEVDVEQRRSSEHHPNNNIHNKHHGGVLPAWQHAEDSAMQNPNEVGIVLDVYVNNRVIVHVHQACSVSHVLWEQLRPKS